MAVHHTVTGVVVIRSRWRDRVAFHAAVRSLVLFAAALLFCLSPNAARAERTTIAVAANFAAAAQDIGAAFEKATGHEVVFSFGPTGQLYTQIVHGAPFDVFLAADIERPERAGREGYGVESTRFAYAIGVLVLWSADKTLIDGTPSVLSDPGLGRVAIANPATAPYGAAAVETMKDLGVFTSIEPRLVRGKSVSQAFQFVATRNVPVGFVALSQVKRNGQGSQWTVPDALHQPLRQDAILLKHGQNNEAAKAFMAFLKSPEAVKMIEAFGYRLPQ